MTGAAARGRRRHARRLSCPRRIARWAERLVALGVLVCGLVLVVVVAGPRFFPYQALIVRSGSMTPTLPVGSVVFYHHESATSVRPGQIILFDEPGRTDVRVTHRVHQIVHTPQGTYFVTKGDANGSVDPWRIRATGTGWVVSFDVPAIGYPLAYLSTTWARLLLVSIPAITLGLLLLVENLPLRRRSRRTSATT